MNRIDAIAIAGLLLSTCAEAATADEIYVNARYGYSIAYPPALLAPQAEAENGDGLAFQAKKGTARFLAYAGHILEGINDSPEQRAVEAEKDCPGGRASYRVVKRTLVAVSCATESEIIYEKTILRDGVATTFSGRYPIAERAVWDRVVAGMASSMKPGRDE